MVLVNSVNGAGDGNCLIGDERNNVQYRTVLEVFLKLNLYQIVTFYSHSVYLSVKTIMKSVKES